jgi:hypothetical protein
LTEAEILTEAEMLHLIAKEIEMIEGPESVLTEA